MFDQPLWIKAVRIIESKSMNIVCRLGGFHLLMSFLGSIGKFMENTGLSTALEEIYGENTVKHMLTGKATSRSIRRHFIVESALITFLFSTIFPIDTDIPSSTLNESLKELLQPYINQLSPFIPVEKRLTTNDMNKLTHLNADENNFDVLERTLNAFESLKIYLNEHSRTAKLWIQYLMYIDIVNQFIRAERTGQWKDHLIAVNRMLNIFPATGHFQYAKSARLYLQMMLDLPEKYPWLYDQFYQHSFHTVRRTDRYWAGIWTDLTIEQVLMRTLKGRGGITRGRGMTEGVYIFSGFTLFTKLLKYTKQCQSC